MHTTYVEFEQSINAQRVISQGGVSDVKTIFLSEMGKFNILDFLPNTNDRNASK